MNPLLIRGACPNLTNWLHFPYQTKPDKQSIQLWKEFILCSFCIPRHNANNVTMEFHLAQQSNMNRSDLTEPQNDCTELI
jgi:hypothetical protein